MVSDRLTAIHDAFPDDFTSLHTFHELQDRYRGTHVSRRPLCDQLGGLARWDPCGQVPQGGSTDCACLRPSGFAHGVDPEPRSSRSYHGEGPSHRGPRTDGVPEGGGAWPGCRHLVAGLRRDHPLVEGASWRGLGAPQGVLDRASARDRRRASPLVKNPRLKSGASSLFFGVYFLI